MKKVKFLTVILAAMVIAGSGCLKDKGFDNHEYGINDPDNSPVGVGFNLGTNPDGLVSTGLTLSPDPQIFDSASVLISLLSGTPAAADVHVSVAEDDTLLTHYNTVNGTSLVPLDPSSYTLSTTAIIPAGKRNGIVVINVPNAGALDPNFNYGLALRLTGADAGYLVAGNENVIILSIAIRNQYDGDYHSNGYFYHPAVPRAIVNRPKTLSTLDATSVVADLGDLGGSGYRMAISVDPNPNGQGLHDLTITAASGAAGAPYTMFTSGLPASDPGYTPQWPRSGECNNVYDEDTKEFKVRVGYHGGTGFRVSEEIIKRDP